MRHLIFWLKITVLFLFSCSGTKADFVLSTSMGELAFELNTDAKQHQAHLLQLAAQDYFKGQLVHFVEQGNVIAFGAEASKTAKPNEPIAPAQPEGVCLSQEGDAPAMEGDLIVLTKPAGNTTDCLSNVSVFYVVQGSAHTEADLVKLEGNMGRQIKPEHRSAYLAKNGLPQMDGRCTVIGRLVKGKDVLDRIAALPRDVLGRPLKDVRIE